MLLSKAVAVGVGKNEQTLSSMRSTDLGSPEITPFRIEPESGKIGQHVTQAGPPQPRDVLDKHD